MHRHHLLAVVVLAAACGDKDSKDSKDTASAAKPTAAGDPGSAPAASAVSQLQLLADFIPREPNTPDGLDTYELFEIATIMADAEVLAKLGPMPPTDADAFLADVRIIGERDLAFGRLTPETITLEHIEQVIEFLLVAPAYELRGYRPRAHKHFVSNKHHDRHALAVEALAYVKEHGFQDPGDPAADNRVTIPRQPPAVKAVWEQDKKRYGALALRRYGRLAWLSYDGGGSAWMPVTELDPPLPEGPAPKETCALAVGAKVKAPWSTVRKNLSKGTITEIYGGMARVKFDDGDVGWAHCAAEIKPR